MERKRVNVLFATMAVLFCLAPITLAQRGMGDQIGVVRQGLKPEIVTLQGRVVRIVTGPCEHATGKSDIGTHFIMKIEEDQEQNIHLGPALLVRGVSTLLENGGAVSVRAFRTDKMPEGHYNAITVTLDKKTMRLRGQNLRPVWAGATSLGLDSSNMSSANRRSTYRRQLARGTGRLCRGSQPCPHICRCRSSRTRGRWERRGARCCQAQQRRYGLRRRIWR